MPHSVLPGRARRDYHAAFYSEFKKPVLERNKEGEIVFVKAKNSNDALDHILIGKVGHDFNFSMTFLNLNITTDSGSTRRGVGRI
jgi:hypothetical protein